MERIFRDWLALIFGLFSPKFKIYLLYQIKDSSRNTKGNLTLEERLWNKRRQKEKKKLLNKFYGFTTILLYSSP